MVEDADTRRSASAAFSERINAGRSQAAEQAYEEARASFDAAARMLPLHPQGYLERGSVRAILGDVAGAADDLGIALALSEPDEDVLRAHFNRASAFLDLRQAGRARVHLELTAAAGVEGAAALLARARREAEQADFVPAEAAEASCARGFELLPRSPLLALSCFEDARRLDPAQLWAVHGAGQANGAIRRPHHARAAFTAVLEAGAEGAMKAEALYNRASLLPQGADDDAKQQARADLQACLELARDPAVPFPSVGDPVQDGAIVEAIAARLEAVSGDEL